MSRLSGRRHREQQFEATTIRENDISRFLHRRVCGRAISISG